MLLAWPVLREQHWASGAKIRNYLDRSIISLTDRDGPTILGSSFPKTAGQRFFPPGVLGPLGGAPAKVEDCNGQAENGVQRQEDGEDPKRGKQSENPNQEGRAREARRGKSGAANVVRWKSHPGAGCQDAEESETRGRTQNQARGPTKNPTQAGV